MQTLTTPRTKGERGTISILETLDIASGKRTVLREFPDTIEAPNWTKDGKYLIYNHDNGHLYRYELATGAIAEVLTGVAVDCNNDHVLSPDGTGIAVSHHTFEDGQSRIYTVSFAGGDATLITPLAPSYLHGWSPDGKTLAYCAERNGQYDVYTIPVGGGRETQLTNVPSLDDGPEYSPDGKHIWFNSTRSGLMQLWRMDADGKNQTQMTKDESNNWFAHLSPDGTRVAYISYRKGDVAPNDHPPNKNVVLKLMDASGGDFKVIAELFGGQGTMNVNSWSPDGSKIAFVSYRLK